jgi:hypothetical protein
MLVKIEITSEPLSFIEKIENKINLVDLLNLKEINAHNINFI